MSLLGSKTQERVLSGVERCLGSRKECDCLRLSERRKKLVEEEKKIEVQTQICIGKCCFEHSENEESRIRCKKIYIYLLDIKSNKGFLLCKD